MEENPADAFEFLEKVRLFPSIVCFFPHSFSFFFLLFSRSFFFLFLFSVSFLLSSFSFFIFFSSSSSVFLFPCVMLSPSSLAFSHLLFPRQLDKRFVERDKERQRAKLRKQLAKSRGDEEAMAKIKKTIAIEDVARVNEQAYADASQFLGASSRKRKAGPATLFDLPPNVQLPSSFKKGNKKVWFFLFFLSVCMYVCVCLKCVSVRTHVYTCMCVYLSLFRSLSLSL